MDSCVRQTLAIGELAIVEQCSCGAIHLTIGAVTLRLAECSLALLVPTINEAARALALREVFASRVARDEVVS